jgi:glutaredoxin
MCVSRSTVISVENGTTIQVVRVFLLTAKSRASIYLLRDTRFIAGCLILFPLLSDISDYAGPIPWIAYPSNWLLLITSMYFFLGTYIACSARYPAEIEIEAPLVPGRFLLFWNLYNCCAPLVPTLVVLHYATKIPSTPSFQVSLWLATVSLFLETCFSAHIPSRYLIITSSVCLQLVLVYTMAWMYASGRSPIYPSMDWKNKPYEAFTDSVYLSGCCTFIGVVLLVILHTKTEWYGIQPYKKTMALSSAVRLDMTVFTKNNCIFCDKLKRTLSALPSARVTYIVLEEQTGLGENETKRRLRGYMGIAEDEPFTFPQVFIRGNLIPGGADGFRNLLESGDYERMLRDVSNGAPTTEFPPETGISTPWIRTNGTFTFSVDADF